MLESLLCNSCGAPLEVSDTAKFVKCNHCNTSLQIHRAGGATSTEAIEKLTATAEGLSEQLEKLSQQRELENLDRNWESQRQSFLVPGRQGLDGQLPPSNAARIGGTAVVFFGVLWTVLAISITQSAPNFGPFAVAKVIFPLFGIGFIAFGIFTAVKVQQMTRETRKNFRNAEQTYRRRRASILKGDE